MVGFLRKKKSDKVMLSHETALDRKGKIDGASLLNGDGEATVGSLYDLNKQQLNKNRRHSDEENQQDNQPVPSYPGSYPQTSGFQGAVPSVYGGAGYGHNQPQAPQYGQPQYGNQAPQYGNQAPQYSHQAPQYGNQPQFGHQAPQYGNQPQYGQPQYGQPQQQYGGAFPPQQPQQEQYPKRYGSYNPQPQQQQYPIQYGNLPPPMPEAPKKSFFKIGYGKKK